MSTQDEGRHTWIDLAKAAGAESDEAAELLLWSGSAFPFASPRHVYEQIRHSVRHRLCVDDPEATCSNRRVRRADR